MTDLITRERAQRNLQGTTFTAAYNLLLDALVSACSQGAEKFTNRRFKSQEYDELHNGRAQAELLLRNYPVQSINQISYAPTAALRVTNTSSSNQKAAVRVTADGLQLIRIASGVTAFNILEFATYTTLNTMAAAITALGSGWSGSVAQTTLTHWPSVDLRSTQGAFNAKDTYAELKLHTSILSDYHLEEEVGIITKSWSETCDWNDINNGDNWYGGPGYWRVQYTAGFLTIPEDVQEAVAEWCAVLFKLALRDPLIANSFSSSTGSTYTALRSIPNNSRSLLVPYKNWRV